MGKDNDRKEFANEIAQLTGGRVIESTAENGIVLTAIAIPDGQEIAAVVFIDALNYAKRPAAKVAESLLNFVKRARKEKTK